MSIIILVFNSWIYCCNSWHKHWDKHIVITFFVSRIDVINLCTNLTIHIRDAFQKMVESRTLSQVGSTHLPLPLLGTPFLRIYSWSSYPPTHFLFGNFRDKIRTFQHQSKINSKVQTYHLKENQPFPSKKPKPNRGNFEQRFGNFGNHLPTPWPSHPK